MSTAKKSTVYVDIEDEITAIIDKLRAAPDPIVAMVLPKRASVLQSVVNMKLLKRAATDAKKNIVLVTTEASLLPLAGMVGLHVARNLQTKPLIPEKPSTKEEAAEIVDDAEPEVDAGKTVGELAGSGEELDEEEIELPPDDDIDEKPKKSKLNKKLRVPSFDAFRLRFFLIVGGVLLLFFGWFFGFVVMPKAMIDIKTKTEDVPTEFSFSANAKATQFDKTNLVLPATVKETKKTEVEKFKPTGEKDLGNKATGSVTFTNCTDASVNLPAGAAISTGNLSFVTVAAVSLNAGNFTGGGVCKTTGDHVGESDVVAQSAGDQYNLSARSYTVNGVTGDLRAAGTAMSGGSSKKVKVISSDDADTAKTKLLTRSTDQAKSDLAKQLTDAGLFPLTETFQAPTSEVVFTPKVGDEAPGDAQASVEYTYSMFGIKASDIAAVLSAKQLPKIDKDQQQIVNNGLKKATIKISERLSPSEVKLSYKGSATAGPKLDGAAIIEEIRGKSLGQTEQIIKNREGITDVKITYSPFWVFSTPRSAGKITVTFDGNATNTSKN